LIPASDASPPPMSCPNLCFLVLLVTFSEHTSVCMCPTFFLPTVLH
jgi:hypothetical protein